MKPTTQAAVDRLLRGGACGRELADAGAGFRYGGRIDELRKDHGYVITKRRCNEPHNHQSFTYEYVLVRCANCNQPLRNTLGPECLECTPALTLVDFA